MSQVYVPNGTWVLCSQGKKVVKLQVTSQSTVKIDGGKLMATELDRFDDNFICPPMMAMSAFAGALMGMVVGGILLGGIGVIIGGIVGAVEIGTVLSNHLPSICSLLCKGSDWTEVHPKVRAQGHRALLQKATLECMLGGTVTLKMPDYDKSIDMGLLSGVAVYGSDRSGLTQEEIDRINSYHRLNANEIGRLGLNPNLFGKNGKSGFHAEMYQKGDQYTIVFRGTTNSAQDWGEDVSQGVGIDEGGYYNSAAQLANAVNNDPMLDSQNTTMAGHSLGGGEAATAAAVAGLPCYTYNAAGVHEATEYANGINDGEMANVQAYNSSGDILNALQDSREGVLESLGSIGALAYITGGLPRAAGQRMQLDTGLPGQGKMLGHSAINVVRALEREAKDAGKWDVIAKQM